MQVFAEPEIHGALAATGAYQRVDGFGQGVVYHGDTCSSAAHGNAVENLDRRCANQLRRAQPELDADAVFFYLNFASVAFAAYTRRRACSCSIQTQMPCNMVEAVKSALPQGRQF